MKKERKEQNDFRNYNYYGFGVLGILDRNNYGEVRIMSFEEEFPNLNKYKKMFISTYYDEFNNRYDSVQGEERVFPKIMVEKNCKDNQKIREAIIEAPIKYEAKKQLFERLGL